jgi:FKBP-type peptidyl-prolyl cis-trans isomerase FklB
MVSYMQKSKAEKSAGNKKIGENFLAANKNKPGVVALPSGLQYSVIKAGAGPKPALTDKVKVHYHGTLIDGKVFDSSVERGEPIELNVNGVIPGWTEALQLMPVGSKWKLFIPSNLAYGDQQAGPLITPGSTLIFDVELLDIIKPVVSQQRPQVGVDSAVMKVDTVEKH